MRIHQVVIFFFDNTSKVNILDGQSTSAVWDSIWEEAVDFSSSFHLSKGGVPSSNFYKYGLHSST